ncbi:formate/nitrite transporter family protein [Kiloniella sp.]|uniref:formate/nitrite transporter family protein n=1 Tax=Kiloniella sp. TaxID=1938587 RepID=UPI003B02BAA8
MTLETIKNTDAYTPSEIAKRVELSGVSKAKLSALQTLILAILGGAFIAFGGMFYTLVITNSGIGFGPERLLGGVAFSLGLILVVVAGAELFTGNNLIVMAWVSRHISFFQLMRNWALVFTGNLLGAIATAFIVHFSGVLNLGDGAVSTTAQDIAIAKVQLPVIEAFFRGLLCNTLVCLAIWLCFAAHSVASKILAILFPVSAFVALGFEHSVANMYLIPMGYMAGVTSITIGDFLMNLATVALGNITGGSLFVAFVYWVVYLRKN